MANKGSMLSKTLVIGIIFIFIGISTFTIVASTSVEKQISVIQSNSCKQVGNTLITQLDSNRVIEIDSSGIIVWQKTGLNTPTDAERLENGNTLIAEGGNSRVIEVDTGGTIVWEYTFGLDGPWDAERLENGNTLITEYGNERVIEVNIGGTIVWEYTILYRPWDAERLANGNTLISDTYTNRVIEVDSGGNVVWEKANLDLPTDAERLTNGNTLISDCYNNRVIEVDSGGTIVWQKAGLFFPFDAERISDPPDAPTIDGQTSGKVGTEYEYTFNAVDPDGDNVKYFINWGDTNSEWTGFNASGTNVTVKHTWGKKGTYDITAKAQDIRGFEGPEVTLTVTMPRNKATTYSLFQLLFERFPLLEVIILRAMNLLR